MLISHLIFLDDNTYKYSYFIYSLRNPSINTIGESTVCNLRFLKSRVYTFTIKSYIIYDSKYLIKIYETVQLIV